MKQFTPEQVTIESASSLNLLNQDRHREGDHYAAYVGLDVHKKQSQWLSPIGGEENQ
jgi:hypothetical protein